MKIHYIIIFSTFAPVLNTRYVLPGVKGDIGQDKGNIICKLVRKFEIVLLIILDIEGNLLRKKHLSNI